MNVNKRDRRDFLGGQRGAEEGAPRSGGRTAARPSRRSPAPAAQGASPARPGRSDRNGKGGARGAREFSTGGAAALAATSGTAALAPATGAAPRTGSGPARGAGRSTTPRLEVAPPPPFAVPRAPFAALVVAVVVGGVLGILLVNTKINENAIQLGRMQDQQATLDLQEQQLEQQIAEAEAPGNLAERARDLGLVDSGPPAFIRLPDGRRIGVPQPGGAESADTGQPAETGQQAAGG